MVESPIQQSASAPPAVSAWVSISPIKKIPVDYVTLLEKYAPFTKGNEFLTITKALEAVTIRIISLLTMTCQQGHNGRGPEKPPNSTKVSHQEVKCHVRHPAGKEKAKKLAGSILTNKSV